MSIADAARLIREGELVAFPTETVYGLGGDATNERAVAKIFEAKGRPQFNPLISHVLDAGEARRLVQWNETADKLAARFWPGPLTLVLPRTKDSAIALLATAGLDTAAVRAPAHPMAQALIRAAGRPIAGPSANRSGSVSPTRAEHVAESLGDRVKLILDGGPCEVGLESTVLDLTTSTPTLLRPGGATREAIEAVIGPIALSDAIPSGTAAHKSPATRQPLCSGAAGAAECCERRRRRGPACLRSAAAGRCAPDPQSQPNRRSHGGGRQPVRFPARPGPARQRAHRGHAHSANRTWPGDQRPTAPCGRG